MNSSFPCFEALDMLALARSAENGALHLLGPPPTWVRALKGGTSEPWEPAQFIQQSHFLQYFLSEANRFWDKNENGELESGPWQEPTITGEECDLEAKAVALGSDKLLFIKKLSSHIRHRLQVVRDKSIETEKERDDLLAILNRIEIGVIITDVHGFVTFINRCALRMLATTEPKVIGQRWDHALPSSTQRLDALLRMVHEPSGRRSKVLVQSDHGRGQRICLEIDVQDDPRNSQRKLFFLYDVTEVHRFRRLLGE